MDQIKKIASFTADHTLITPGIYISRKDGDITTYDLRMKAPNKGDYLSDLEIHSLEHMLATYIRNGSIGDDTIYVGPMGCRTGFYLLVRNASNAAVLEALKDALKRTVEHTGPMFGQSEIECGNYRELSCDAARSAALDYLKALEGKEHSFLYPERRGV